MSAIAYITMVDGELTRDSTITVWTDGVLVDSRSVPECGHGCCRSVSGRILSGLAEMGWQVVGRVDQRRETTDGEAIDVEPLSGASLDVAIAEGWVQR